MRFVSCCSRYTFLGWGILMIGLGNNFRWKSYTIPRPIFQFEIRYRNPINYRTAPLHVCGKPLSVAYN